MRSNPSLSLLMLPLVEVVLMGLLAGLVGAVALVHRRIFFTESLTHATFPGAILGVVVASWFSRAVLGQRADFELLSVMVLAAFIGGVRYPSRNDLYDQRIGRVRGVGCRKAP